MVIVTKQVISCGWGLTGDEIRLASDAAKHLAGLGWPLYYAVVGNAFEPEQVTRERIRTFKSIVAKEQRRSGVARCLWLEMLEGEPGVHSNILFPLRGPGAKKKIYQIAASKQFPGDTLDIQPAKNPGGIIAYCSKERTPQARFVGGRKLAGCRGLIR